MLLLLKGNASKLSSVASNYVAIPICFLGSNAELVCSCIKGYCLGTAVFPLAGMRQLLSSPGLLPIAVVRFITSRGSFGWPGVPILIDPSQAMGKGSDQGSRQGEVGVLGMHALFWQKHYMLAPSQLHCSIS